MNKRGQFYLITAIAIIALISGFASVVNFSSAQSSTDFKYLREEIDIEGDKMVDYILSNNLDFKKNMTTFTRNSSVYSDADSMYFVFGDSSLITVAAYKKLDSGTVNIISGSTDVDMPVPKEEYTSQDFNSLGNFVNITSDNIKRNFKINEGKNFYFIVSKETGDEIQVYSNG